VLKDVQHVDLLFKTGEVYVTFGILIRYFVQWSSYLLQCTPPSSTFIESFISFVCSFLQVFGRLLGLGSFDSPEGPLACKQAFLPINFNGIGLINNHHCPINLFRELGLYNFSHNC
jgi:hypothetical protein